MSHETTGEKVEYQGESHDVSIPTPHHTVNYYAVFALLIVMTVITVVVAFLGIEKESVKVLLALFIASIKATAVAYYFMHLKFEGKLIYCCLIVPAILTILLICALLPDQVTAFHAFIPSAAPTYP